MMSFTYLEYIKPTFSPLKTYLIDCGSSTNTLVRNRVFITDDSGFKFAFNLSRYYCQNHFEFNHFLLKITIVLDMA